MILALRVIRVRVTSLRSCMTRLLRPICRENCGADPRLI
jgi:hypothetical protein